MTVQALKVRGFTGWHMLAVLGLFFGVTIIVNLTLAFFASSSWTGLVVKNSYVASQHFNEHLANERRQASLGWSDQFTYDHGMMTLRLTDANGVPVSADVVHVVLRRPVAEQQDHEVRLLANADGTFTLRHDLGLGVWAADLRIEIPGQADWVKRYRFIVRANDLGASTQ
ncbi:MAG: FixH family protein [Alphaproteobacteria bacterium]|nr:FixH family protein [Alphaproteobacteria bacterium]